jgi:hypothetical protein
MLFSPLFWDMKSQKKKTGSKGALFNAGGGDHITYSYTV